MTASTTMRASNEDRNIGRLVRRRAELLALRTASTAAGASGKPAPADPTRSCGRGFASRQAADRAPGSCRAEGERVLPVQHLPSGRIRAAPALGR